MSAEGNREVSALSICLRPSPREVHPGPGQAGQGVRSLPWTLEDGSSLQAARVLGKGSAESTIQVGRADVQRPRGEPRAWQPLEKRNYEAGGV